MKFNFEALKKALTDKKASNLFFLFLLGIALLVISNIFTKNTNLQTETENISVSENNTTNNISYEANIEERLKKILRLVEGVGNVDVMITISYGRELVIAQDYKSETKIDKDESDQSQSESIEKNTVILGNTNQPIVLKEIEPKIEGVIIIAQGGDNLAIKEQLIRAAQAILNIPVHKIEILKMK